MKFYAHNDYREFRVLLSSLASDWQLDGPVAKLMDDCALSDKLRILNGLEDFGHFEESVGFLGLMHRLAFSLRRERFFSLAMGYNTE